MTLSEAIEAVNILRVAFPHAKVQEDTPEVWFSTLRNRVTYEDLKGGINFYITDKKTKYWPTPGQVLEYAEKYRVWRDKVDLEKAVDCRMCGGNGLVRGVYTGDKYDGRDCYTPCSCPVGKLKTRSLIRDEKAGLAHKPKEARRYVPERSKDLSEIEQGLFGRSATDRVIAMTPKIRAALEKSAGMPATTPAGNASVDSVFDQAKNVLARALPLDDDEVPF